MAQLEEMLEGLQCPICGHENSYHIADVDVTYKVGENTVTINIHAGVCQICGEHAYDAQTSAKIDSAVQALRTGTLAQLHHEGEAYRYQ